MYRYSKGSSFLGVLIAFALGGLIGVGIACLAGWICGSSGGGGGGGGTISLTQNQCTSDPNACGLVSLGTGSFQCPSGTTPAGGGDGGPVSFGGGTQCQDANGNIVSQVSVCDAVPPSNSLCPAPTIPPGNGFTAQPSTVGTNGTSLLSWTSSNTTDCSVTGDNGFKASGGSTDSASTTPLTQSTTFTLTCVDGTGGPSSSASVRIIVNPQYKEI